MRPCKAHSPMCRSGAGHHAKIAGMPPVWRAFKAGRSDLQYWVWKEPEDEVNGSAILRSSINAPYASIIAACRYFGSTYVDIYLGT
jgi:hypothetical protein